MIDPLTGLEKESEFDAAAERRRRVIRPGRGLRALAGVTQEESLEQAPLQGGELSRPPELEQPAPLSTEAVPRVPSVLQATPLLDQRERAGAMLAEAERGEESLPGPGGGGLSNQARQQALMNFFRPARAGGAPSEEGPSDVAEGLGTARRAVGGLRQAESLRGQLFPRAGSFGMPPETRAAFEAQRAGERMDFGGALPGGAGETEFPGLDSFDQWLGAGGGEGLSALGGAIPAESLYGIEAGLGEAGGAAASTAGSALGSVGQVLPYLGALAGIGQTIAGDEPSHIKALDSAAYAGAPFTFGLTALLPTIAELTGLKKLFRGKPDIPHEVRESRELARHAGQTQGFMGEMGRARSLDELYQTLLAHQTGYVGGTAPQATNVGFRESPFGPAWDYLGLYGGGGNLASNRTILEGRGQRVPTSEEFFQRVRQDPESLFAGVQAGVNPGMLTPLNMGLADVIRAQVRALQLPPSSRL